TLGFGPVSAKTEEQQQAANEPSTSASLKTSAKVTKRKKTIKEEKASGSQENAKSNDNQKPQKPRKKIPIPPLPSKLPPVNLLHRDIVRAWCHQLKLSTKGQKLEAYKRLCEYAYPNQNIRLQTIPATAKEAKIQAPLKRKSKVDKGKTPLEGPEKKRMCSEETNSPEVASPPEEGAPALESALPEGVNSVVVTTSAQESALASWTRIAGRAGRVEALESPPEGYDQSVWSEVVCGTWEKSPCKHKWLGSAAHAGQVWVPEKPGRVSALFLLPACNFPPPHLEDNMLCPKCVQRNKVLMKSLQ
uniref:Developmental pluripotency associated 4 n=1 Tax=Loxodonta africana TaxID=9785 RepID=G3U585_LOXAF